jgi:maleylacetate reductase
MPASGVFQNVPIDRVVYGRPAASVLAEEVSRLGATRVYLMVSRTLDRETSWVQDMRSALGNRYAGSFDGMPSHTPRDAVLSATSAARAAGADMIVTFGGGSITDAGKMVRLALRHGIEDVSSLSRSCRTGGAFPQRSTARLCPK